MIHPTADVSDKAKLGKNVSIWNNAQVREDAIIGDNTIIGKNVYIDKNIKIGKNVKIQNNVSIYDYAEIKDGVFIGPHVCFTNDKFPRAVNVDGSIKSSSDWQTGKTIVEEGASIGAKSVLATDIKIGKFSLIGIGSVVTKDVPDYALVYGNPARLQGYMCKCGRVAARINTSVTLIDCVYCNTKLSEILRVK